MHHLETQRTIRRRHKNAPVNKDKDNVTTPQTNPDGAHVLISQLYH